MNDHDTRHLDAKNADLCEACAERPAITEDDLCEVCDRTNTQMVMIESLRENLTTIATLLDQIQERVESQDPDQETEDRLIEGHDQTDDAIDALRSIVKRGGIYG